MRHALATAFTLAALAAGCSPSLTDGRYTCSGNGTNECPPDFICASGHCRNTRGSECVYSLHCQRPCNEGTCVEGWCIYTPIPDLNGTGCTDGLFCNGEDACLDGACIGGSTAPCTDCTEDAQCSGCGDAGLGCCAGDICFDATECQGGTCVACGGSVGATCCTTGLCGAGLMCDDTTMSTPSCVACGGEGARCCPLVTGSASTSGCEPGLACILDPRTMAGSCVACGHRDEPCCDTGCEEGSCAYDEVVDALLCRAGDCAAPCAADEICAPSSNACQHCGDPGEPCCPGEPLCSDGMTCTFGACPTPVMPG